MTMQFRKIAEQAAADGQISPAEILQLRRESWSDGVILADEAEALFAINDQLSGRNAEWAGAFVEAMVEHLISGGSPRGYVTQDQADWLVARIDRDGRIESLTELELLARLFERASWVPDSLKAYANHQIEQAVLTGSGPTRDGGQLDAGCITEAECRLLRRFIFAQGGDRPAAVSQGEAELLFRIKDATLGASNAPEWPLLFVQGVGNYLQGWSGGQTVTPDRARQLEQFMNAATPRVGRFFSRMATGGFGTAIDKVMGFGRKDTAERDFAGEARQAEQVTAIENAWLQSRFDVDGKMDELEHALLVFLADEPLGRRI